ncbi:hypothetical protein RUM43_008229 [Polyplax serrata]|uniref:Uncharacterized protein n=1 Tax=Polyplax serrata TaxID=468196 RepID=A0AAN8PYL6_POLSC
MKLTNDIQGALIPGYGINPLCQLIKAHYWKLSFYVTDGPINCGPLSSEERAHGRMDVWKSWRNSKKVEKDVGQGFVPETDVDRLAAGGNDKKTKKHV